MLIGCEVLGKQLSNNKNELNLWWLVSKERLGKFMARFEMKERRKGKVYSKFADGTDMRLIKIEVIS